MGFRFRKSFKVAPGVKLNLSKSGIGMSAGVRGARVGISSRGNTYSSIGIPGTGIYSTSYSKKGRKTVTAQSSQSNSGAGVKVFLWIVAIILGIALPPLGAFMLVVAIFYYYQRNKSPKYQAEKRNKKATTLIDDEKKYEEAVTLLLESQKLDPENKQTSFLLGAAYHNSGQFSEAIPQLLEAYKNDPTSEKIVISLANSYFNTEKYDDAISLLQGSSSSWENNLKAIQLLGMSFANQKKYDLAIDVFKKAPLLKRNLDADLLELHYNLGLVYEEAGKKKEALKHFKKVYAYDINYKEVKNKIEKLEK
ncbi:MAG TPA: DUF4236 domain-containing protein [Patescibacteria group bacterium]